MGKLNILSDEFTYVDFVAFNSPMGKLNKYTKKGSINFIIVLSIPLWVS